MICARCDQPIRPGQDYRKDIEPGATGAGGDFYVHARCRPNAAAQPRRHPTGLGVEDPWRF